MAAALYSSRAETTTNYSDLFARPFLMNNPDMQESRYPSIRPRSQNSQSPSQAPASATWSGKELSTGYPSALNGENDASNSPPGSSSIPPPSMPASSSPAGSELPRSTISYSLPQQNARRVVERYSLEEPETSSSAQKADFSRPPGAMSPIPSATSLRSPLYSPPAELAVDDRTSPSATPRRPLPPTLSTGNASNVANFSPALAQPAQMGYVAPVSSRNRAYPQQPTYINQAPRLPNPVNPIYGQTAPGEEICVECTMRDQDMADVDVTTPGVWERESDAAFEDLRRREEEDDAAGIVNTDPARPRVKGGRLTEPNIKLWLSVNPREPSSRQQTLNNYVRSQRTLIEAETLARARALQEAKQLDNRMRDAYSQLRRSAYDMGNSAAPVDDSGGVRIKPPVSPINAAHDRTASREVTLLENGMIVEHVDVRKEEREARDRRRREEKRIRKLSRSSNYDVASAMSTPSLAPYTDSGIGLRPYSQYSQPVGQRPMSVLTAPSDRPDLPRTQSQLSFSDVHSVRTGSPRRSSFFPRSWIDGLRSVDSLAPSGSMVDMHVALQRETQREQFLMQQAGLSPGSVQHQVSNPGELTTVTSRHSDDKSKKKSKGLGKIWRFVTGSSKKQDRRELNNGTPVEDDLPLAPPPPLSYLVNRTSGEGGRHASTPSLPSVTSTKFGSPPTQSSMPQTQTSATSLQPPSPASSRPSGSDGEGGLERKTSSNDQETNADTVNGMNSTPIPRKNVHSVISEPDIRKRMSQPITAQSREKNLPPLPGESRAFPASDSRPRTMYTMNSPSQLLPGSAPPHDFLPPNAAFRGPETRRQSFGGLTSRPNLFANKTVATPDRRVSHFGASYDEFGGSRRSLQAGQQSLTTSGKRKSRFALSSLLGKKPHEQQQQQREPSVEQYAQQFPTMSNADGIDETATGYSHTNSRHSAFSTGGPRMSVTSRKALEDLVTQDSDFVAYRYPSNGQRLDLLR